MDIEIETIPEIKAQSAQTMVDTTLLKSELIHLYNNQILPLVFDFPLESFKVSIYKIVNTNPFTEDKQLIATFHIRLETIRSFDDFLALYERSCFNG